jgi:hypothetical protein
MDLLSWLRDPLWQGVGAILAATPLILSIPVVRKWLLQTKQLEAFSFRVGLLIGLVCSIGIILILEPVFSDSPEQAINKQGIKVYESATNKPRLLEGSHYALKPETEYVIEIINLDSDIAEVVWQLVPENFGQIKYVSKLNSSTEILAFYTTPNAIDSSSGFIKVCELDASNLCRNLNLPEIAIVITK